MLSLCHKNILASTLSFRKEDVWLTVWVIMGREYTYLWQQRDYILCQSFIFFPASFLISKGQNRAKTQPLQNKATATTITTKTKETRSLGWVDKTIRSASEILGMWCGFSNTEGLYCMLLWRKWALEEREGDEKLWVISGVSQQGSISMWGEAVNHIVYKYSKGFW